jgi:hypothetical protein
MKTCILLCTEEVGFRLKREDHSRLVVHLHHNVENKQHKEILIGSTFPFIIFSRTKALLFAATQM